MNYIERSPIASTPDEAVSLAESLVHYPMPRIQREKLYSLLEAQKDVFSTGITAGTLPESNRNDLVLLEDHMRDLRLLREAEPEVAAEIIGSSLPPEEH